MRLYHCVTYFSCVDQAQSHLWSHNSSFFNTINCKSIIWYLSKTASGLESNITQQQSIFQISTINMVDALGGEMFSSPTNSSGSPRSPSNGKVPHFAAFPSEKISVLAPYSGLILTICLVVLYLTKRYCLEILFPKVYKRTYLQMTSDNKRGFLVHHLSATTKILLLCVAFNPFIQVVFGSSALHDRYMQSPERPTNGDVLLVTCQLFIALYIFELMTRKSPSPIAVAHHVGAVMIGQSAIALSLRLDKDATATMQFVLCVVWGAFDCLAELWLNVAFILYRIYPTRHSFLSKVFACTAIVSSVGTLAETIVVMTLFGRAWEKWDLSFKIVTPILHVLFTIAQLHAAKILFVMWAKQKMLAAENRDHNLEAGRKLSKNISITDDIITDVESPSTVETDGTLESGTLGQDSKQKSLLDLRTFLPGRR
jgi:hypothetical protein